MFTNTALMSAIMYFWGSEMVAKLNKKN